MYFNIKIKILDYYSFECEKVHMLVFINYYMQDIQVSLQCDQNNVYCTWKPLYINDSISLNSS